MVVIQFPAKTRLDQDAEWLSPILGSFQCVLRKHLIYNQSSIWQGISTACHHSAG